MRCSAIELLQQGLDWPARAPGLLAASRDWRAVAALSALDLRSHSAEMRGTTSGGHCRRRVYCERQFAVDHRNGWLV